MQNTDNLRYNSHRRVNYLASMTATTTHFNHHPQPHSHNTSSLPNQKLLPRLVSNPTPDPSRLGHYSVDVKKMAKQSILSRSRKPLINWERLRAEGGTRLLTDGGDERYKVINKQGKRSYNEDKYICKMNNLHIFPTKNLQSPAQYDLFAIFDGHGGQQCSEYLKNHFHLMLCRSRLLRQKPEEALKETFSKVEQQFLSSCQNHNPLETSGSCAVVCMISGDKVHVANLGDSRAMLLGPQGLLELTKDHKPQEMAEKMRILKHGGKLYKEQDHQIKEIKVFRSMRIFPGNLNVSRTIGDIEVKVKKYGGLPGMISSEPDTGTYFIQEHQILLLASDGLFEAFTNAQISQLYQQIRKEKKGSLMDANNQLVERLTAEAQENSSDNITVIGVVLGQ